MSNAIHEMKTIRAACLSRQAEQAEQARLAAVAAENARLERVASQEAQETVANVTADLPPIEDGSTQESQDILADGVPIPVCVEGAQVATREKPSRWPAGPCYIAGRMRKVYEFNFPAFFAAEAQLVAEGAEVGLNPARYDVEVLGFDFRGKTGFEDLTAMGFNLRRSLAHDLEFITTEAAWICVLPGWDASVGLDASSGVTAEVAAARAIGIPVLTLDDVPVPSAFERVTGNDEPGWLCKQAARIVNGGRNRVYGPPENNFHRIAILWGAWECVLETVPAGHLRAEVDVAIRNILQKLARIAETPDHTDSWRDVAGYADCGARCAGCDPAK